MTIEQLRRLKHLSEMPTHFPDSLRELRELVRMATIMVLLFNGFPGSDYLCENCVCRTICKEDAHYDKCELHNRFQLRMEDA